MLICLLLLKPHVQTTYVIITNLVDIHIIENMRNIKCVQNDLKSKAKLNIDVKDIFVILFNNRFFHFSIKLKIKTNIVNVNQLAAVETIYFISK